jgi:broad specificity phosphatase PhoE
MSTRLTLICHAATAAAPAVAFFQEDPADPAQLARVAGMLPGLGEIARIWSAPELRARQTAEMLGTDTTVMAVLRDCDFGRWRGRALAYIQAREPEDVAAWLSDMGAAPHGGESLLAVLQRIGEWLDRHRDSGHTVAVTHPAVIRAAVVRCLDAPPQSFWRIDVEPLSVTDLRLYNGRWTLRSVGRALA